MNNSYSEKTVHGDIRNFLQVHKVIHVVQLSVEFCGDERPREEKECLCPPSWVYNVKALHILLVPKVSVRENLSI